MIADANALPADRQSLLLRLRNSLFVKNVLVVMTGTAVAQTLGFALSPVISRLFSPSDFGVFGSFDSVARIIAVGATLEYTQALMLPKAKLDAFHLLMLSFFCTFAAGFLCFLACLVAPETVNGLLKTKGGWGFALLILATVTAGLNTSCQAWCVRAKAFKHTSASQVVRSLSSNGMQIGFGCLRVGALGLIISIVVADVLASLNLVRVLLPDVKALRSSIRWERIKELAYEYRDFPLYSSSMNLMNALSLGLPVLLLTHYYGTAVAGAYAFGLRIVNTPANFVINPLRQVLFQRACETRQQGGRLLPLYLKTTAGLFTLAIVPSLVLLLWGPAIFAWVFGTRWQFAGELARWLVLWLAFMFCNLPAVLFSRVMRMQQQFFFFSVIVLAARTLALVAGGRYLTPVGTVLVFSVVGSLLNVLLIMLVGIALVFQERHPSWKLDKPPQPTPT